MFYATGYFADSSLLMGKQQSGKTVIVDQLQDLLDMLAQRFTTLFDVFQVKEMSQKHVFSDNRESVLKYFALVTC